MCITQLYIMLYNQLLVKGDLDNILKKNNIKNKTKHTHRNMQNRNLYFLKGKLQGWGDHVKVLLGLKSSEYLYSSELADKLIRISEPIA